MVRQVILALVLMVLATEGKKILLIGFPFTSHMNELMTVGRGLISKGHEVYAIMDVHKMHEKRFKGSNLKFLTYDSLDKEQKEFASIEDKWQEICFRSPRPNRLELVRDLIQIIQPIGTHECSRMVHDHKLIEQVREKNFDIAILDSVYYCSYLIPHKLGIPYVSLGSFVPAWKMRIHPVASLRPCEVENDNSLFNRFKLFLLGMMAEKKVPDLFTDESQFMDYTPEKPYGSLGELVEKSSLFLINQNSVMSCAAPSMPNIIYVGGLTNHPAKPLDGEFTKIVNEAKNGVIVMSFGSGLSKMPKEFVQKFLTTFRKLNQVVIWRLKTTYDLDVPSNVRIVDWMPQNDLLGHDNVKLFITHGGNNGRFEALYHGMPMIGCPLYGDQDDNIDQLVHQGFALKIDIAAFTGDELLQKITDVIENPKYRTAIKKASAIHRSLPDPVQQSVYWIEHIMDHGSDHLRSVLFDFNPFQFLLLDIFAVFLVFILIVGYLLKLLTCFAYQKLCGPSPAVGSRKKQD